MSELYTIEVPEERNITRNGAVEITKIVTTYFDVEWKQLQFYIKKHKAEHITVERQTKKLGYPPKCRTIDEIQWSEEAKAGTRRLEEARKKLGGGTKPVEAKVSVTAPTMKPGEKVKMSTDYADLVNVMMKESA